MSNDFAMSPTTFKYGGNIYKTIVRFPFGVAGVIKLDSCCEDLVLLAKDNPPFRVTGEVKSTRQKFVRAAAEFCGKTSGTFHQENSNFTTWLLPDGTNVETFAPKTVIGTSKESTYLVIAHTAAGNISFCHGPLDGMHRMRVALWPSVDNGEVQWSLKDRILSSKNPQVTFQTIEHTHMSYSPKNLNQAIAVIARGLDALFNVKKI